jgi:prolyl-tRNA synthetase
MKYRDLQIQTQRETPNNARTEGFAFLVRAGYLTRENELTPLGQFAVNKLEQLRVENESNYFSQIGLPVIIGTGTFGYSFHLTPTGRVEIMKCHSCEYADLAESAIANKLIFQSEGMLPMEKVYTPDCNTIESLSKHLKVHKNQTAKAMMFVRTSNGRFLFVVLRGDTQLNLHKLTAHTGEIRPATTEEILATGAVPGYASPIGIKDALVIVDELVSYAKNLIAGANEEGHHLLNTNYGRDYSADVSLDIVQVEDGDICAYCEDDTINSEKAEVLADGRGNYDYKSILLALAESYHDDKGLTLPHPAAPFDVYLMYVPGREVDTYTRAGELYDSLTDAGISVLFDDRDERAGVKFSDADLIGLPIRVTVGEKGLREGMVELKQRTGSVNQPVGIEKIAEEIKFKLK